MGDLLSKNKYILVGWILEVCKNLEFTSIFHAFADQAQLSQTFKECNKKIITCNLLKSNFNFCKALIENSKEIILKEEEEILIKKNQKTQNLMENFCNTNNIPHSLGKWLDNYYVNINSLGGEYKKAIAYTVANYIINYCLSFDEKTRHLCEEDLTPISQYYIENINERIFYNNYDCISLQGDANELILSYDADLLYFYPPSMNGFQDLKMNEKFCELFNLYCDEESFNKSMNERQTKGLGAKFSSREDYKNALFNFLKSASHIPIWLISYNNEGVLKKEEIIEVIKNLRKKINVFNKDINLTPLQITHTEYLFLAHT